MSYASLEFWPNYAQYSLNTFFLLDDVVMIYISAFLILSIWSFIYFISFCIIKLKMWYTQRTRNRNTKIRINNPTSFSITILLILALSNIKKGKKKRILLSQWYSLIICIRELRMLALWGNSTILKANIFFIHNSKWVYIVCRCSYITFFY